MDVLSLEHFVFLFEESSDPCASLYMPTHKSLPEARQDPIRFKNLLRRIEGEFVTRGLSGPEIRKFLKPAEQLLDDPLFWRHQDDGLAVFLTANEFRKYRLPISFQELVVVGHRFHVKPIIPLFASDDRFFLLALSQKSVRLIECTRYGASAIDIEGLPKNLEEVLSSYDAETQLQFHTRAQGAGAKRAAVFHGQGGGTEDLNARINEYFRLIDAGLQDRLRNEKAPLVLAGVNSLFPLYRNVNSYQHLMDHSVGGNPDSLTAEALGHRARELVEPYFQQQRDEAMNTYSALTGTGQTSTEMKEIVTAAHDGRVEVLFVPIGVQIWGSFDELSRTVLLHEQKTPDATDLLDLCAVRTIQKRGSVYVVDPSEVPGGASLASLFRF